MARITYASKAESDYRIYGAPTGYFDDYYEERQRRFMAGASQASQEFFTRVKTVKDKWHGEEAIKAGRLALAKISNNITHGNYVRELKTIEDFQTARTKMQEIVCAHPEVNKRVLRGQWSGYGIEYEVRDELYDHARDGVVVVTEDTISYTQVLYVEGDETVQRFTDEELLDIDNTYQEVERLLEGDVDITSAWG